jgi:hypothetical protein
VRRAIAVLADALVLLLATAVLVIIATGGGVFIVRGVRVSATGVDNPLLALTALFALRYTSLRAVPWFGAPRWSFDSLDARARCVISEWRQRLDRLPPRSAILIVTSAAIIATLIKALLAWTSPGFFSGDDVEVHEMSIGALWGAGWPIWDLRNALFPLGVVYPAQWVFASLGLTDAASLVFAGRLAVATLSSLTVVLVWRAGIRIWPSDRGWAVVAALLFAATQLHIAFGSSELPRPVATVLVIGAFVLLQQSGRVRTVAAGVLLGIAASLRFSEIVFLAPAVLTLAWKRQWSSVAVVVFCAAASALAAIAVTDAWYWGQPFHSLDAAIDYTLVQRLSSRGYQNPLWYLLNLFAWLSPAIAVFSGMALLIARRLDDLWFVLPIALLSALPHKEARYMNPVVPFVWLAAVRGLSLAVQMPRWRPVVLVAILSIGLAHDAGHWRLPRSTADVLFARHCAVVIPRESRVAIVQAWRGGGRLYLHPREVVDLDPARLGNAEYLWQTVPLNAAIVLDGRTRSRSGVEPLLQARGYQRQVLAISGSRYELWLPPGTPPVGTPQQR